MGSTIVPQETGPVESSTGEPVSVSRPWEASQQSFKTEGENWLTRTKSDPTGASSSRFLDQIPLATDRSSSVSVSRPDPLDKSRLSLPTARSRSAPKISRKLQLPSFDSLGIAVPHPDRPRLRGGGQLAKDICDRSMLAANNLHTPARDSSGSGYSGFDLSNGGLNAFGAEQYPQGRPGCSLLLTPPDENGVVDWGMSPQSLDGTAASSPSIDLDNESKHSKLLLASTATSDSGMDSSGPDSASFESSNATERNNDGSRTNSYGSHTVHDDGSGEGKLNSAVEVLCNSPSAAATVSSRPQTTNQINSIHEEEPAPISTALTLITDVVQEKFNQRGKRAYIHINYAVLPTFDLGNLPTTPPLTGPSYNQGVALSPGYFGRGGIELGTAFRPTGSSGGSPGYFGSSLFSSVVLATQPTCLSYQGPKTLDGNFSRLNSIPMTRRVALPSPNPILPPSSQHISLLERYIPPPSPSDDQSMFSSSSSILFDRLFELSPNGGSMLFIYPTRTGAREFCRHYLGPVIEPLLRRLMVLHQLPPHLLMSIQKMTAVDDMMEFEDLHAKLQGLCDSINTEDTEEGPMGEMNSDEEEMRAAIRKAGVQLLYASRKKVCLDNCVWPEWWAQQEASRVRQLVRRHFASMPMPPPTNPITLNLPSTFPSSAPTSVAAPLSGAHSEGSGLADDHRPSINSPSQLLSYTSASPGDLSREVLEGVRALGSGIPNRGFGEVVADSLLRSSGPGGVGISMGTTGLSHGRVAVAKATKRIREGVEVGVFVLRRAR
ncbi:MAG: hypothetical protein M1839_002916 [Geoglossum umbratile]|nr:MAG: hypothetical protein M1839_002916 [Geoglossum umbratile]